MALLVVGFQPFVAAAIGIDFDMLLPAVVLVDDDVQTVRLIDRAFIFHVRSLSALYPGRRVLYGVPSLCAGAAAPRCPGIIFVGTRK